MKNFTAVSVCDQFTEYLREAIISGSLRGSMPGIRHIASEQGVSPNTVIEAVARLEREGFLLPQGPGRRSQIVLPEGVKPQGLRVAILLYEKSDAKRDYMVEMRHALSEAGHLAHFCSKSLIEMKFSLNRVKRLVAQEEAGAWVIFAGTREILTWFAEEGPPAFACGGRRQNVNIAGGGPGKWIGQKAMVDRLVELGHERIVILAREERRKPNPGLFERSFLERLQEHGIKTGAYNLPDWEDGPEGLFECLRRCFEFTPPTAMFTEELHIFLAVQQYLAQQGILAPRDVSLICGDPDPAFDWCHPKVAHLRWDSRVLVRRILGWMNDIARGKDNRHQTVIKTTFVDGGTVGPVPTA